MADSEPKPEKPAVPSWQRAEPEDAESAAPEASSAATATDTETETATEAEPKLETKPEPEIEAEAAIKAAAPEENMLDVARKFLDDDAIRDAPLEKKVAFLEAKGISDANIQTLLADAPAPVISEDDAPEEAAPAQPPAQSTSTQTTPSQPPSDRAPIVTYPEFLAKPARPPPLVTTNRLLNTLYAVVGLSTLVYGTGKYVLGPMVDAQTEARADFHEATVRNLDALVAKLEKTVSEVPPAKKNTPGDDESEAEDPAEMFHRDMGTQTSFPLTTTTTTTTKDKDAGGESTTKRQADRLAGLTKTLSGLKDEFRSESEGMDGIKTLVDVLRDDLDSLTYPGQMINNFDLYGRSRKPEPEDEIRKVRDNIRRVKGVLLSTRNFPTTAR